MEDKKDCRLPFSLIFGLGTVLVPYYINKQGTKRKLDLGQMRQHSGSVRCYKLIVHLNVSMFLR